MQTFRGGTGWAGATWPTAPGAADTTTWTYQAGTGLLLKKTDANDATTTYGYTDLGQINKRVDARGWVTNYEYTDPRKLLSKVDYTGVAETYTGDLEYIYDRAGRMESVTQAGVGKRTFSYYDSGTGTDDSDLLNKSARLKTETLPAYLGSHSVTYNYQYATPGRANGAIAGVKLDTGSLYAVTYAYDDVLRLNAVAYNSGTAFTYAYSANSNLMETVTQGAGYRRDYDYETKSNRLGALKHSWNGGSQLESRVTYDVVGRRNTEKTQGAQWMSLLGRASEAGVHADYTYTDRSEVDSSGKYALLANWNVGAYKAATNRNYAYDPIGNRTSDQNGSYTPNLLNQYTAAPGFGAFSYDENGNLKNDGIRTYDYDAENRLIRVTQGASVWDYVYDFLGRRIAKSGTGIPTQKFLYDGWNLVAELDAVGSITRKFVWGLDVSGSLQGAGGIGGLLILDTGSAEYRPIYDASRNVVGLYDGSGALAAAYEYDPFGNTQTASSGGYATANPFRSATKYTDLETGMVYYGLRYYSPQLGRFINRDPIEEAGGLNLYAFCGNDGVNRHDMIGMEDVFDRIFRTGGTGPDGATGNTYARDSLFNTTLYGASPDKSTAEYYATHELNGNIRQDIVIITDMPYEGDPEGARVVRVLGSPKAIDKFWGRYAPNSEAADISAAEMPANGITTDARAGQRMYQTPSQRLIRFNRALATVSDRRPGLVEFVTGSARMHISTNTVYRNGKSLYPEAVYAKKGTPYVIANFTINGNLSDDFVEAMIVHGFTHAAQQLTGTRLFNEYDAHKMQWAYETSYQGSFLPQLNSYLSPDGSFMSESAFNAAHQTRTGQRANRGVSVSLSDLEIEY